MEPILHLLILVELIIAIDFGTTYSGVAYYLNAVPATSMAKVLEKTCIVKPWPPANPNYLEKTPTVLAYNDTEPPECIWGGAVKPSHRRQIAHFKLGLVEAESLAMCYGEDGLSGRFGFNLQSSFGRLCDLPNMRPVDFTADYLRCLHKFVAEIHLANTFRAQVLKETEKLYIITVPAIWSDGAKNLTRLAAMRAIDVPEEQIVLVTEPEAAALYCATVYQNEDLEEGDRILICDAGGGTLVRFLLKTSKCRTSSHTKSCPDIRLKSKSVL
jgi:molecular chaperone DnaK (HSP70)